MPTMIETFYEREMELSDVDPAVRPFLCKTCRTGQYIECGLDCCAKCGDDFPECCFSERKGGLCPACNHAYELALFTPPDHVAANCPLCTAQK